MNIWWGFTEICNKLRSTKLQAFKCLQENDLPRFIKCFITLYSDILFSKFTGLILKNVLSYHRTNKLQCKQNHHSKSYDNLDIMIACDVDWGLNLFWLKKKTNPQFKFCICRSSNGHTSKNPTSIMYESYYDITITATFSTVNLAFGQSARYQISNILTCR